jgi:hypothetical protein
MTDSADHRLLRESQLSDLAVGQSRLLREPQQVVRQVRRRRDGIRHLLQLQDLVEVPRVDPGGRVHVLDGHPRGQCEAHGVDAVRGGVGETGGHVRAHARGVEVDPLREVELRAALLERAHRLEESGAEVPAQRHDLAHALHRGREGGVRRGELLEREAGDLDDDVVERGLERRRGDLRDVVGDLVERVADRQLRGDLGDREARRLRRERGRPGHARVHLDDDDAAGPRVDRVLDVAAARVDAHLADDRDADVAHPLVLAVREGECRGDRDRVARVDAHGVDVLDRADDHDVVRLVAHELELVLLPAQDALLEQDLVRDGVVQPVAGDPAQVVLVVGQAGPQAAHREGRADDQGIPQLLRTREDVVHRVADDGPGGFSANVLDDVLELLAVLAALDRLDVRADELDVVRIEDARVVEGDRGIEGGLAAQGGQERVGALLRDDRLDDAGVDRLDVRDVRDVRIRHDRRGVRVHEDDAQALAAEHAAGLGPGVVELAGLADHDGA